jgi:DNA polymerase-3 subunit alpha
MAALISSVMNTKDKVPFYVAACDELEIEVLPPDVNESQVDFAVVEGKIRFGLNAVKNVGEATCRAIVAAREEDGCFTSVGDLVTRVDAQLLNRRVLEALAKCGALDRIAPSRLGVLEERTLDQILAYGQRHQADRLLGQASIFDLGGADASPSDHEPKIPLLEADKATLLHMEKESLGLYVSEHPLSAIRDQLRRRTDCTLVELERRREGETLLAGGIVASLRTTTTKKGEPMAFVQLEDVTGSVEVVVFNSTYAAARELLVEDAVLVVKGRIDHKQQGETKLVALEVTRFEATPERREVRLKVDGRIAPAGLIKELGSVVRQFPGEALVYVDVITSYGEKKLELGENYRVSPDPDFYAEVRTLLGAASVQ